MAIICTSCNSKHVTNGDALDEANDKLVRIKECAELGYQELEEEQALIDILEIIRS